MKIDKKQLKGAIIHRWSEENRKGKHGEREVWEFFSKLPKTCQLEDVRDVLEYRNMDVDFLRYTKTLHNPLELKFQKIEVKSDYQEKTGNYFIETWSNFDKNKLGCFMYSEADVFAYYFPNIKQLHLFCLKQVREWFIKHQNEFREVPVINVDDNDNYLFQGRGRLVKKEVLQRNCPVYVINLNEDLTVNNSIFSLQNGLYVPPKKELVLV